MNRKLIAARQTVRHDDTLRSSPEYEPSKACVEVFALNGKEVKNLGADPCLRYHLVNKPSANTVASILRNYVDSGHPRRQSRPLLGADIVRQETGGADRARTEQRHKRHWNPVWHEMGP